MPKTPPLKYYDVLKPIYSETGLQETKYDDAGNAYHIRWQQVEWECMGIAKDMADAKRLFPRLSCPVLRPVGFRPRELL